MKKTAYLHIVCLLLALLLLFCACADATVQTVEQRRLTVEEERVTYSVEFATAVVSYATELLARIIYQSDGLLLSESEQEALALRLERDFLPVALRAAVTPEEMETLLTACEAYLTCIEAGTPSDGATALSAWYQRMVAILGTDRAGQLCYDGMILYLNERIAVCEARYLEYGYVWYREDAECYRTKLSNLTDRLGVEPFGAGIEVLTFITAFCTGGLPAHLSVGSSLIRDGEILAVLRMQAERFAALEVSAEQWSMLVELFSDWTPGTADTPWTAELSVCQSEGIAARLAVAVPELLQLLSAVLGQLTQEDIALWRTQGEQQAKITTVCRAIALCKAEFMSFTASFSAAAELAEAMAQTRECAMLEGIGALQACNDFLEQTLPLSAQELFDATANAGNIDESAATLTCAWIGYLRGVMPYFAFALSTEL